VLVVTAGVCCRQPGTQSVALKEAWIVAQRAGDDQVADRDVEGRTDEPVVLHLVVRAAVDGTDRYYSAAGSVVLGGKSVETAPWPRENGPLQVRWYSVRPRLRFYDDSDGHNDKIQFVELPVRGVWSLMIPRRCGTYRFRVRVSDRNGSVSTPGIETETQASLLPGVRRVSVRENRGGGDNIDFMTMFFGVAYVYGNTQSQADNFIGIDCQDLCIYGLNRTGLNISYDVFLNEQYSSHIVFDGYFDLLGRTYDLDEKPAVVPVLRGDIIRFADMHHYGAIYADRSLFGHPNGHLDMFDDVINTMGLTAINKFGWFALGDMASLFRHPRRLLRPPRFRFQLLRFQEHSSNG
jgi:hypothetical protein